MAKKTAGTARKLAILLVGLELVLPPAFADGAGGNGDNSYTGGSGSSSGTRGNGGTGGTAVTAGHNGIDSGGGTVSGGSYGVATNTATGSVNADGATGSTAQTISVSDALAAGASIVGGGGGGGGYQDINSGSPAASGQTIFSAGNFNGGSGGIGLHVTGNNLTFSNAGEIAGGGGGGAGHNSFYLANGADSATVGNTHGGAGGTGVSLSGAAILFDNVGAVMGGAGGGGGTSYVLANGLNGNGSTVSAGSADGGAGGSGLDVSGGDARVSNSGSIAGGNGGSGGQSVANGTTASTDTANGGAGGNGVTLAGSNAILSNTGTISGGQGGAAGVVGTSTAVGAGGAGIVISGDRNTVITSGNIGGGLAGNHAAVTRADAISINGNNNTVQLQAGYSLAGNVVAYSGSGNVLSLGGSTGSSFDVSSIASIQPTSYTGSAQYFGFASYAKTGSSSWTLTGSNTASLSWNVNDGSLLVDAQMANAGFVVNSGGTLGGTGRIGTTTVNSGGTLAADSPGGGLTINGNLSFASGSTYRVAVDSGGVAGLTTVNGNLLINAGSTLQMVASAGSYTAGTRYAIASYTGGLTGSFTSVTHNFAYLTPSVTYGTGSVSVLLVPNSSFQASGFDATAVSNNQQAVAGALNQIHAAGGNAFTRALLAASASQARSALAAASGDVVTAALQNIGTNIQSSQQAIGQRLAAADTLVDGTTVDVDPWISVALGRQHRSTADSGASAYDNRGTIVSFGHDHMLSSDWLAGFAFAVSSDRTGYLDVSARARSDGVQAVLYARYRPQGQSFFIKGMTGLGWWNNVLNRQLAVGSYASDVEGRYKVRGASLYGEVGYSAPGQAVTLEPYAALSATLTWRPAYVEATRRGGSDGLALAYGGQRSFQAQSSLGVRLHRTRPDNSGPASLQWQSDLTWRRRLGNDDNATRAAFVNGAADTFIVRGTTQGRDELALQASLSMPLAPAAVAFGQVGAAVGRGYQSYGIEVGVRWGW